MNTTVATPPRRRSARRILLILGATPVVLAAAGALYQSVSVRRDAARFPPQGRLVDVGGRRLHLICIGQGSPTIVFEMGAFGGASGGRPLREALAAHTRVCSYDRMGMGWSDPGPAVITIGTFATDLQRLLDGAGVTPPYVLVSESMGGLTAELFARRHPDQIAGLVFLDAGHSDALVRIAPRLTWRMISAACLSPMAARLGILRLVDPLRLRQLPPDASARATAALYRVEPMATFCGIARGVERSVEELRTAPPLRRELPMSVLTAESTEGLIPGGFPADAELAAIAGEWRALQQRLAQRSSRSTWRIVPGTRHSIASTHSDVVATAVLQVLAEARDRVQ